MMYCGDDVDGCLKVAMAAKCFAHPASLHCTYHIGTIFCTLVQNMPSHIVKMASRGDCRNSQKRSMESSSPRDSCCLAPASYGRMAAHFQDFNLHMEAFPFCQPSELTVASPPSDFVPEGVEMADELGYALAMRSPRASSSGTSARHTP
jgi:hypothetical protein